jgi:hypothetical protein
MSKDLFFSFLRSLTSYDSVTLKSLKGENKMPGSLHLGCKDSYSRPLKCLTNEEISTFKKNFLKFDNPFNYEPTHFKRETLQGYIIFREKVKTWSKYLVSQGLKPYIPPVQVLYRSVCEGQKFADYTKKLFSFSIRKTIGLDFVTEEESIVFEDINQIYPPQHLMNFMREKDISDMTDYSNKEPVIKSDLSLLKDSIRKNLKKDVILRGYDFYDHIDTMDEKGSFLKGTTTFKEKFSYNPTKVIPGHLTFRINSIHKTPCESRTVAIAEPYCKSFLHYTRSQYTQLLDCKYNYYGEDRWSFEKKLHERYKKYHFLFDQKKCGWTFPMELIEAFFEVLIEFYPLPEFKALHNIFKYKQILYIIDGKEYSPKRGYTLGMFDDICSFIISCLADIFVEDILPKQNIAEYNSVDILIFGDDCDVIVESEELYDVKYIGSRWLLMLDQHGITVNLDKSFYSKSGIFCEVYGHNNNSQMLKHITYLLNGLDILNAHNTAHAKVLLNSYYRVITTYFNYINHAKEILLLLFNQIVETVISNFPVEFTSNEKQLPFEVGGWIQCLEEGQNLLLEKIYKREIHQSFINVSTVQFPGFEKNQKKKIKNSFYDTMTESDFWQGISFILSKDIKKGYFKEKFFSSFKNTNISGKVWWQYQLEREKAFNCYKGILPESQVIFKFPWYKMKIPKELLELRENGDQYICRKKPSFFRYKPRARVDKKRALDMIRSHNFIGPYLGCHLISDITPIKDIYASLDLDLASCKYIIPTDWWSLCRAWDIPIERFYQEMLQKGFDPFLYKPKSYKLNTKEIEISNLFDLTKPLICWCDKICSFITLDYEDTIYLDGKHSNIDNFKFVLCNILNLSEEGLISYISVLEDNYILPSPPDNDDDLGLPDDYLSQIRVGHVVVEEEKKEISQPISSNLEISEGMYFLDQKDIEDRQARLKSLIMSEPPPEEDDYSEDDYPEEGNQWDDVGEDVGDILTNKPWLLFNKENKDSPGSSEEDDPG